MAEKYENLKVKELQDRLSSYNLSTTGKKEELINRLVQYDEMKTIEALERDLELDTDIEDSKVIIKESVISDDEDVDFILNEKPLPKITAPPPLKPTIAVTETVVTEPVLSPDPVIQSPTAVNSSPKQASSFHFTPITFDSNSAALTKVNKTQDLLKKEAERRLERSKRFGVKLTDKEKRELRAARFGIVENPSSIEKINNGKVAKNKKVKVTAATKNNVLIKKQDNIKKIKQGVIEQNKKSIIQQRRNNTNKQQQQQPRKPKQQQQFSHEIQQKPHIKTQPNQLTMSKKQPQIKHQVMKQVKINQSRRNHHNKQKQPKIFAGFDRQVMFAP